MHNCTKGTIPDPSLELLQSYLTQGTWTIDYFIENENNGPDQPNEYEGYLLVFEPNGSVVAHNGIETINGKYAIKTEMINQYPVTFLRFDFLGSDRFQKLNLPWEVYGQFPDHISLRTAQSKYLSIKK
jgi:hypothetical protein